MGAAFDLALSEVEGCAIEVFEGAQLQLRR
jgi:hypothetical protein